MYIQSTEVCIVDTLNLRVGGEHVIKDAVPPVILVLEKESILD